MSRLADSWEKLKDIVDRSYSGFANCCKTCKHCEEYEALDYEYLCPEPAFRCKAKNRELVSIYAPRPFCPFYEHVIMSVPMDEMPDIERKVIKPKTTNCPNCGAPIDIHAEKCAYCDTPYI